MRRLAEMIFTLALTDDDEAFYAYAEAHQLTVNEVAYLLLERL